MATITTLNIPPVENLLPERPAPFDLLVIPQSGDKIPMPHVPDGEIVHMLSDYAAYGNQPIDEEKGHWDIGFAHRRGDVTSISSILRIPRSIAA